MLTAIAAGLKASTRTPEALHFTRRALYQFAEFMGCICGSIPLTKLIGIKDERILTSSACPLHGVHPDHWTSPYYG